MDVDQGVVHLREDEVLRAKIMGSLTKVAVVSVTDIDSMIFARHYSGLGSKIRYVEVYVVRGDKYLGRFEMQEKPIFDVPWIQDSDQKSPSDKDLSTFRKARMTLFGALDKLWS